MKYIEQWHEVKKRTNTHNFQHYAAYKKFTLALKVNTECEWKNKKDIMSEWWQKKKEGSYTIIRQKYTLQMLKKR